MEIFRFTAVRSVSNLEQCKQEKQIDYFILVNFNLTETKATETIRDQYTPMNYDFTVRQYNNGLLVNACRRKEAPVTK